MRLFLTIFSFMQNYPLIMQIVKKKCIFSLGLLSLTLGIGCSKVNKPEGNELTMGTSADYPPFEFQHRGEIMGFDVDVAKAITEELGYELKVEDMDFGGIIPALKSGRIEFAMAGITATPERSKSIDFSTPYYTPQLAILSRKDAPVNSIEQLPNKKIGVQLGSTMEAFIKEEAKELPGIDVIALGRNPQLVQELKVGRIDGVILEVLQAKAFSEKNSSLEWQTLPGSQEGFAIAFPKNSPLTESFNEAIEALKNSGKLEALQEKWLKPQGDL